MPHATKIEFESSFWSDVECSKEGMPPLSIIMIKTCINHFKHVKENEGIVELKL